MAGNARIAICCTVRGKHVTDPYCEEDFTVNSKPVLAVRNNGRKRAGQEGITRVIVCFLLTQYSNMNKKKADVMALERESTWRRGI